jgi:hypothetical protein
MKKILIPISCAFLFSCGNSAENEDLVKEVNKNGSIETVINVAHEGDFDILKTTHKVWVNGAVDKTIETSDTLKTLPMEMKTTVDENENEQEVLARKDYELYITVK